MKRFAPQLKRLQNLALAAGLAFTIALGIVPQAHAATSLTAVPRITFTFDDGLTSSLTQAAPTLQKYGFSGTNYVITKCADNAAVANYCPADPAASYMTWDQIKTLHDTYGWNIGSHTEDHPLLASTGDDQPNLLTPQQVHDELANSKATLATHGYDAVDFAAPYGDYNNVVLAEAAKMYSTFRGFADIGNNVWPYNDRLVVNEQVQEGTEGDATKVTFAMVKGYVDAAIANNQWLILTFHDIRTTASSSSDDYTTSTALLDQIAAYVKTQVDASKAVVVSPHEGIVSNTPNMLGDGSFDGTLATDRTLTSAWTTDDTTAALVKKDTATNGSYVLGNNTSAQNSLYISAAAADAHIWAPKVAVDAAQTYIVKGYFNIQTITAGEVAFYIDEYDASGAIISTAYASAVRYDANVNAIRVKNANFTYKPSSAAVTSARMYINVQGNSGITGFMDNVEMLSQTAGSVAKIGDMDGNGIVNNDDATILFANWGTAPAAGDIDNNGVVNNDDATLLFANWSK
jgi:peptidoglycan/xylan/chitin deacetylase (PgdA/CDA1 family)